MNSVPTVVFQKERKVRGSKEPWHITSFVHLGFTTACLCLERFQDGGRGKLEVACEKEK